MISQEAKMKLFSRCAGVALALMAMLGVVAADDPSAMQVKLEAALALEHRSEENRARDDNRDPIAAMQFCRLEDHMTVIEFGPGAGWYTEILGPVLQEHGRLLIAYKGAWMERLDDLLARDFMSAVEKNPLDIGWNADERRFDVGDISFNADNVDLALNIREYHNFDDDGAAILNQALASALRPGGYYCIIDHTRRHMEEDSPENRRRADPVRVILEVQSAGFELIAMSDMFFRPDDELRYEVGRRTVKGNTDRFALLFRRLGD
jgi:predicted methyltransferase